MARPRKTTLPDLLAAAAERLEALGEPELAAAVRDARAKLTASKASPDNPTLPLYVQRETWERAQAAGSTIDAVEAGFTAFLAGKFTPKPLPRGGDKTRASSRASSQRTAEVEAYAAAHADELGWTPSASQVANAWLEHKYGKPARR
ncbi:hypothetical protein [Streptomyces cavernae]|uniref:hypothetical protein n=1 Tax=Streptomyces cavernae TaxID=2259034 RepID=UPI000FEC0570|nr:hypothetical protein [Streptomyces cavernae]